MARTKKTAVIESQTEESLEFLADNPPPPGKGPVPPEILALWHGYEKKRSQAVRDRLIEYYMPLVDQTAQRLAAKLPACVDIEDLRGAGTLGLIDAIEKFQPSLGYKFETYCSLRISGAIFDDLRRFDWVPRLIRNRAHLYNRTREELETEFGRAPTHEEMAERMGISQAEMDKIVEEMNIRTVISLDRKWDEDDDHELGHLETLPDARSIDPFDEIQRNEIKELAIRGLSPKEKAVLVMYYFDNLNFKEIGAALDISESRVCQLHQQTISRLRNKFDACGITTP